METKMLFNYFSRVYESLKIWAQVYEIINPIKDITLKIEQKIGKLYGWLVAFNIFFFFFLTIMAYNIMKKTSEVGMFFTILFCVVFFGLISQFSQWFLGGLGFALRCYTITGYKSIWLFIIAFFIPQIYCVVCSIIYFFS